MLNHHKRSKKESSNREDNCNIYVGQETNIPEYIFKTPTKNMKRWITQYQKYGKNESNWESKLILKLNFLSTSEKAKSCYFKPTRLSKLRNMKL